MFSWSEKSKGGKTKERNKNKERTGGRPSQSPASVVAGTHSQKKNYLVELRKGKKEWTTVKNRFTILARTLKGDEKYDEDDYWGTYKSIDNLTIDWNVKRSLCELSQYFYNAQLHGRTNEVLPHLEIVMGKIGDIVRAYEVQTYGKSEGDIKSIRQSAGEKVKDARDFLSNITRQLEEKEKKG